MCGGNEHLALEASVCSLWLVVGYVRLGVRIATPGGTSIATFFLCRSQLEFRTLKDGDPLEEHQITVAVRKRPLNKKGKCLFHINPKSSNPVSWYQMYGQCESFMSGCQWRCGVRNPVWSLWHVVGCGVAVFLIPLHTKTRWRSAIWVESKSQP